MMLNPRSVYFRPILAINIVNNRAGEQASNSYQREERSPGPQITLQAEELKLRWTTHR